MDSNRLFSYITIFIIFFCMLWEALIPTPAQATTKELNIIFAASMSEIYQDVDRGGLPQLKTIVDTIRETEKNVLFIHGGSALSPGMLSSVDKGAHMISLLNMLQPTAMAVAKSELAHREDELSKRSYEAAFPLINCNLYDPETQKQIEGIYPNLLINIGGIKIGLLSVVHPDVMRDYLSNRVRLTDIPQAVSENAAILRKQGAEIIILVGDFTLQEFNNYFASPAVDLVLLNRESGKPRLTRRGNSLFELTGHAGYAAIIELRINDSGGQTTWTSSSKLVDLKEYPADEEMSVAIQTYLAQLSDILDRKIGITHTRLDTTRKAVRTGENSFANYITDTLRNFHNSDIGLINGGGIRGDKLYREGSILTWGDIQKQLPYNNRVVDLKIKGKNIISALENGLGTVEQMKGSFPHVSGIVVEYNPADPPGKRLHSVTLDGHPLELEKEYTLTTIDYLASGGDGYSSLKAGKHIVKIGETRLLWEYAKDQIIKDGEISPVTDGRMKAIHVSESVTP